MPATFHEKAKIKTAKKLLNGKEKGKAVSPRLGVLCLRTRRE